MQVPLDLLDVNLVHAVTLRARQNSRSRGLRKGTKKWIQDVKRYNRTLGTGATRFIELYLLYTTRKACKSFSIRFAILKSCPGRRTYRFRLP